MAIRECPRPETYTDPNRVQGKRLSYEKGCRNNTCGYCGPRLADDWARAVTATPPDVVARLLPPDDWQWTDVRKFINRLTRRLRGIHSESGAVWWVEDVDGAREVR